VCLCGSVSLQDRLAPMSAYEKNVSVSTHRRETGATIDAYRHMRHMRWQVMDNLHTATYCNTLQHSAYGTYSAHGTYEAGGTHGTFHRRTCTLQHAATHCNTLHMGHMGHRILVDELEHRNLVNELLAPHTAGNLCVVTCTTSNTLNTTHETCSTHGTHGIHENFLFGLLVHEEAGS